MNWANALVLYKLQEPKVAAFFVIWGKANFGLIGKISSTSRRIRS